MRRSNRRLVTQLDLFRPVPKRPAWQEMPADVQQNTVTLLAQLLREHLAGRVVPQDGKRPADE